MKAIMMGITALLVGMVAHANTLGAHNAWSEIQASREYNVSTVYPAFGSHGIFNACATETTIQAVTPVKTCVETKFIPGRGELPSETICVRYDNVVPSMPRSGVTSVCTVYNNHGEAGDGSCLKYVDQHYEISLTQNVDVTYANGERYGEIAFTKSYTIPFCQ